MPESQSARKILSKSISKFEFFEQYNSKYNNMLKRHSNSGVSTQ